jgi:hypothetical protein
MDDGRSVPKGSNERSNLCVRAIVALMIHKPEALARSRRQ